MKPFLPIPYSALLLPLLLAAPGCKTEEAAQERPAAIFLGSGDDCSHLAERFTTSLTSANLKVSRERVKGALILSGSYKPEEGGGDDQKSSDDSSPTPSSKGDSLSEEDLQTLSGEKKQAAKTKPAKPETYYLVIKLPSPATEQWNQVLKGQLSTCFYKHQQMDVILKMTADNLSF